MAVAVAVAVLMALLHFASIQKYLPFFSYVKRQCAIELFAAYVCLCVNICANA